MIADRTSEFDVDGEAFDRPPCPVATRLFICSSPRTGSYLLCRAMIHHGIGVPHEYFNMRHIAVIGPRFGIPELQDHARLRSDAGMRRRYNAALMQRRTANGIFAAKIQGWEFTAYLDNAEGIELFNGGCFIHLRRDDLLSQAISFHIARLTGRWGADGTVTTPPAPYPDFFDVDQIAHCARAIAQEDAMWRLFFARNGIVPLTITYEDLTADVGGTLRRIADAFALDLPARDFAYVEPPPARIPPAGEPSRSAIRERVLRQRRFTPAPRAGAPMP